MRQYDSFNPITRRGLRIHYVSPFICELGVESSGSGFGIPASLDILPVNRLPGPASLTLTGNLLEWTSLSYAFAYAVYYSPSPSGPFLLLTSNVRDTHFEVVGLPPGVYTFKTTGIEPDFGETLPSPTISGVIA